MSVKSVAMSLAVAAMPVWTGCAWSQDADHPQPPFSPQRPTYTTGDTSAAGIELSKVAATVVPPDLTLQAQAQFRLAGILASSQEGQTLGARPVLSPNRFGCDPSLSAFDWRSKEAVSPVKDQRDCGDCFIFASTGAFEASWFLQNGQHVTVSEQQIMDCAASGTCEGGWHGNVLNFLKQKGVASDTEQGFGYLGHPIGTCRTSEHLYSAINWSYVDKSGTAASVPAIKGALCGHGPVVTAVYVTPAFQRYTGGVFNEFAEGQGEGAINHDVLIVGWDDAKDAWLIKNSWGADRWGEKGYMWIRYRSNYIGFGAAWVDAVKLPPQGHETVATAGISRPTQALIYDLNKNAAETVAKELANPGPSGFHALTGNSSSVLRSLGF